MGSSPLTRGKRGCLRALQTLAGLIPAHAGKTLSLVASFAGGVAHPRSRGENLAQRLTPVTSQGSSPLTRGKPERAQEGRSRARLIPAHAGKTEPRSRSAGTPAAHPRSRGENPGGVPVYSTWEGSSPLTRGKPSLRRRRPLCAGLIPAHAGKTPACQASFYLPTAHPRSRGENKMNRN